MTTSLEMLQIKPFSSKRYPSDLVRHLYIPETPAASFILLKLVDAILLFKRMRIGSYEYANEADDDDDDDDVPKPAQSLGTHSFTDLTLWQAISNNIPSAL